MKIGTTFSYLEAEYLGLDWEKALGEILNLGLNPIRIGAYWSEIEKKKGKYNFSLLDKQIERISKRGASVILVTGVKSPRWPEFYFPHWLEEKLNLCRQQTIKESPISNYLFPFLEKTVNHYKNHQAITHLQVENEPLNFSGPKSDRLSPKLLAKEVKLVKKLTKKPIILNSWVEMNPCKKLLRDLTLKEKSLDTCLSLGDILGLSVYPSYPGQPEINDGDWQIFGEWLNKANKANKEAWVVEMQAEPWPKEGEKKIFKDPFGNSSCNPTSIKSHFTKLRDVGFKTILLWGSEFWVKCAQEGNKLWLKAVQNLRG